MEFSEGWKSVFPIGASTVSPLLVSDSDSASLGPLLFNPNPNSLTLLFSSASLIPPLHIPPYLSLPRFLLSTRPCSILPSFVSSVASSVGPNHENQNDSFSYFCRNRVHLLKYPDRPNTVVLFPTGEADEKVGFFTLRVKDSVLDIQLDSSGDFFRASSGSMKRILTISVNAVADFDLGESGFESNSSFDIGHLLASAHHYVYWFTVKHDSILDRPRMKYLGYKPFNNSPVVHACWSPHILEESLVLLESGQLFLFDLDLEESRGLGTTFKGTRLRVPWNDFNCSENKAWLSCEFSYGPRILIVARSDAVFLVDLHLHLKECTVTCLMKIETLRMYAPDENERFLALSRAGPDNTYFTLASSSLLLLCNVKKRMEPVLQWVHGIDGPCYITALSLSRLRSHSKEDTFKLASESGFCIILGSFWNCDFSVFCYGSTLPFRKGSIASKLSKINKTFCAWELPFEINLSSRGCHRGNCLLREVLSKDAPPEWIDWQLKKDMVLGFGILSNDLATLLCEPDEHGGFTLLRRMSSGTFELQRYHASWDLARKLEDCHEPVLCLESPLLYPTSNEKYKFKKKIDYLKFDYLEAYAKDNLCRFLLDTKLEKPCRDAQEEESFCAEVHELLCEKLNACGFGQSRSCPAITAVFKDVKLPTSFHEVALKRLWTDLPLELLQLAFLRYSECREFIGNSQHRVALEFLAVPDLPQLPPFFLRQSSPHCNDDIVGPVIPFPVLLVLNEDRYGCSDLGNNDFSVEAELGLKYKEVMQVAGEIAVSCHGSMRPNDHAVSLADDREETWVDSLKPKTFSSYRPVAFNCSATDVVQGNSVYSDAIYDTFIFHVSEKSCEQTESVGQEMFDDLCPIELRFDAPVKKFEHQGLKAYNLLKRQMTKWQGSFDLYNEFCIQSGFEKVVNR